MTRVPRAAECNQAVIFDMDGVLIDSEPLHFQSTRDVLAEHGVALTEADYFGRYIVYSDWEIMELLLPDPAARPGAVAAKSHRYLDLVRDGIPAFPDGLALLARTDGWRVGLATGSMRIETELALAQIGVRGRFEVVVTREDCVQGKPDPEPFLRAAEALGIAPARCVVIEDTPGGIQAARAAGMRCVAVTHSCPRARLAEADLVVDDLAGVQLDALLPERGASRAG
jgi:HAD superfamily hydrolase (TIGR01509 family)